MNTISSGPALHYVVTDQIHDRCVICRDDSDKTAMVAHPIIQSNGKALEMETEKLGCFVHVNCLASWIETANRVYRSSIDCPLCLQPISYDPIPELNVTFNIEIPQDLLNTETSETEPFRLYSRGIQKLLYIFKKERYREECSKLSDDGYKVELIHQDLDLLTETIGNNGGRWKNRKDQLVAELLWQRLNFLFSDLESKNDDFSQLLENDIAQDPNYIFCFYDLDTSRAIVEGLTKRLNKRWYALLMLGYDPKAILEQIQKFDAGLKRNNYLFTDAVEAQELVDLHAQLEKTLPSRIESYLKPHHLMVGFASILAVSAVALYALHEDSSSEPAMSGRYRHHLA